MNKKIVYLITATAVISSIITLSGTFLYNKANAQNVTKGSGGCPISAVLEAQENGPLYSVHLLGKQL